MSYIKVKETCQVSVKRAMSCIKVKGICQVSVKTGYVMYQGKRDMSNMNVNELTKFHKQAKGC